MHLILNEQSRLVFARTLWTQAFTPPRMLQQAPRFVNGQRASVCRVLLARLPSMAAKRKCADARSLAREAAEKKKRDQSGKRTIDQRVQRAMELHVYPFLSKQTVETERVDNKLIREHVQEAVKQLSDKERLGCVFWTDLLRKYGQRTPLLSHLAPASPEDPVADQLIAAVQVATAIDNKVRSMDSLSLYLGFASCLNEKDRPCAHAVFTM